MNISKRIQKITYRSAMLLALFFIQGMLAACGQEPETEALEPQIISSEQHTMEEVVWIMFENYLDDVNEITGEHCIVYVNGVEIPEDEEINYGVGEYEWIGTELSREELLEMLERYTDIRLRFSNFRMTHAA